MATITSGNSGGWEYGGNWVGGVKPGINDDVVINHDIILDYNNSAKTVTVNGSLKFQADLQLAPGGYLAIAATGQILRSTGQATQRKIYSVGERWYVKLTRTYPDTRVIDLGGMRFQNCLPTISCEGSSGNYPQTDYLFFGSDAEGAYWMAELSAPAPGAELQEIEAEGVGQNYARWKRGHPRSFRVSIKFPKIAGSSMPYSQDYGEALRRMVESPYTCLILTPSAMIRGQIESVVFQPSEGSPYHKATLTIVEGRDG